MPRDGTFYDVYLCFEIHVMLCSVMHYDVHYMLLLVTLAKPQLTGTLLSVLQVKERKRLTNHEYREHGVICPCWARLTVEVNIILITL